MAISKRRLTIRTNVVAPFIVPQESKKTQVTKLNFEKISKKLTTNHQSNIDDLHLTTGDYKILHSIEHLLKQSEAFKQFLTLGDYGENYVIIMADLLGRQTNANESLGIPRALAEASERYLWSRVLQNPTVPSEFIQSHKEGKIYIHKTPLSFFIPYCVGYDTTRIVEKGVITETSRLGRPKSFWSAVDTVAKTILQVQKEHTGAVGLSNLPWIWAPFYRMNKLPDEEVKYILKQLYFETINLEWRLGNQAPFSNWTDTLVESDEFLKREVKYVKDGGVFGDYEEEATKLMKLMMQVMYEKFGRYTFPVSTIYLYPGGKNWKKIESDPELFETFLKLESYRGSFYILNSRLVNPNNSTSMCYHKDDRLLIKHDNKVDYVTFEEMFERFAGEEEDDGWFKPKVQFEVLAVDPKTGRSEWRKVSRIRRQKPRDGKIYKITLTDGRYIRVDKDHQLLFYKKDNKSKKYIPQKDKVENIFRLNEKPNIRIPVFLGDIDGQPIKNNDIKITPELAYVLGLLYADGHLFNHKGKKTIRWYLSSNKVEQARRVLQWLSENGFKFNIYYGKGSEDAAKRLGEEFNVEPKALPDRPSYTNNLWIDAETKVYDLFKTLGVEVNKAQSKNHIPWIIWSSPYDVRKAFIQGFIEGDGYHRNCCPEKYEIHLGKVSRNFAEEFVALCHLTNIRCTIAFRKDGTINITIPIHINDEKKTVHYNKIGDLRLVNIKEVIEETYDDYVYDVEIEGDIKDYLVHMGVVNHDCCRYIVQVVELEAMHNGGTFSTTDSVGSKNVTTINFPYFALKNKGDMQSTLDDLIEYLQTKLMKWITIHNAILTKAFKILRVVPNYLYEHEFKRFFMTIGITGMPETGLLFTDNDYTIWGIDEYVGDFEEAVKVEKMIRKFLLKFKEEARKIKNEIIQELGLEDYNYPLNFEEVPAETASTKLFWHLWRNKEWRDDLRRVLPPLVSPDAKAIGEAVAKELLGSSYAEDLPLPLLSNFFVPRWSKLPILSIAYLLSFNQPLSDGGTMFHFDSQEEYDIEELWKLFERILTTNVDPTHQYGVVYFSWSPVQTHCKSCGFETVGVYDKCPKCGSKNIIITQRVTGWNTRADANSVGKQLEFARRGMNLRGGKRMNLEQKTYAALKTLIDNLKKNRI